MQIVFSGCVGGRGRSITGFSVGSHFSAVENRHLLP